MPQALTSTRDAKDLARKTINKAGTISSESGPIFGKVTSEGTRVAEMPARTTFSFGQEIADKIKELATGLTGKTVDGAGNIVDCSGKVLGKVSGDITEMVGKTVDGSGNVLSSSGEIVGHVIENMELGKSLNAGNILDDKGNIIGRAKGNVKTSPLVTSGTGDENKLQAHPNFGSDTSHPTVVFLNIQSTRDGISITIRIPTGFMQQQQQNQQQEG
jgi:hypothetical protein